MRDGDTIKSYNEGPGTFVFARLEQYGAEEDVFRAFRSRSLSSALYFSSGALFSRPQIWMANRGLEGPWVLIGCLKDGRRMVLDCRSGAVVAADVPIAVCDYQLVVDVSIAQVLYEKFTERTLIRVSAMACSPCESFDLSLSGQLSQIPGLEKVTKRELQRYQAWMAESSLPTWCVDSLIAFSSRTALDVGTGQLLAYDDVMEVNSSWSDVLKNGFLIIGFCPVDANAIVIDLRNDSGEVGYMALEEMIDGVDVQSLYTRVSNSFPEFLHEINDLGAVPFDCHDARIAINKNWRENI